MPTCSGKMKLAPSPTCNCGLEDQTAEHILQRCPLPQTARTNVWPAAVQLHTTLYGCPATHHTLWQSSYTPNSMAVQLHTTLYFSPVTHQTLWQSSYTPHSMAVQLHTKLYGSPATHQTLLQQGGSREDGHSHLADWTLSVAVIKRKKKNQNTVTAFSES